MFGIKEHDSGEAHVRKSGDSEFFDNLCTDVQEVHKIPVQKHCQNRKKARKHRKLY